MYNDTRSQIWITLLLKVSLYHLILTFDIRWTILAYEVTTLVQYIRDHSVLREKKRSETIMKF